jgi:hypothetical protein
MALVRPTKEELFRAQREGSWHVERTQPPPMRSCTELVSPGGILVHGERRSGRTHTLIDVLLERERYVKAASNVSPFLLVYPAGWDRGGMLSMLAARGVHPRHSLAFGGQPEVTRKLAGVLWDGLLVDGWADLTHAQRDMLLATPVPIRYWTL